MFTHSGVLAMRLEDEECIIEELLETFNGPCILEFRRLLIVAGTSGNRIILQQPLGGHHILPISSVFKLERKPETICSPSLSVVLSP